MNESLHTTERDRAGSFKIAGEHEGQEFTPFEETIVCPGCNRPLQMMLQPVHAQIQIRCPRCVRQLTPLIRRAIREHMRG